MKQLKELLTALNTETKDRDQWLEKELIDYLINKETDLSLISPTILGSIFESTLNLETRRKCGIHYTSIENIHKVIDPLFLDDLKIELNEILEYKQENVRNAKLREFQDKIASLTFLDPACGSGNFLIETYLSLRDLEDEILIKLYGANERDGFQTKLIEDAQVKVSINQFYGIEINDFAVDVAKTALWIAEYQCLQKTLDKGINTNVQTLPLKSNNNIIVANALKMDWNDLIPSKELNYIMGNPPFVGKKEQSIKQKEDMLYVFRDLKSSSILDYVSAWFSKAADYIIDSQCAFVSTNSITQGQQAPLLWNYLLNKGITINFAYQTFNWQNESNNKAHIHCVIISISKIPKDNKFLVDCNNKKINVSNINCYLKCTSSNHNHYNITSRNKPISNCIPMIYGSMPIDDGNLIIKDENEYDLILNENPNNANFLRRYIGGKEFLNGITNWCIWLKNIEPSKVSKSKTILQRITNTYNFRSSSSRPETKKLADLPYLFGEIRQPESGNILVFPKVSSQKRLYLPCGFVSSQIIISGSALMIPNADMFHFSILSSVVHNAWMRFVCGRMKSDYQYSINIIYNNFVWVKPTEQQKEKIEKAAQSILDARNKYPDSTLADLYDSLTMPPELRKAHENNDKAVLELYGLSKDSTEEQMVELMFKLYDAKIAGAKISGNNNTNLELL